MNSKSNILKPLAIVGTVLIIAFLISVISARKDKGSGAVLDSNGSECSQYSRKDGYTGCNSIKIGKNNKCKFKIDNKINETTQKMEFQYTCLEK